MSGIGLRRLRVGMKGEVIPLSRYKGTSRGRCAEPRLRTRAELDVGNPAGTVGLHAGVRRWEEGKGKESRGGRRQIHRVLTFAPRRCILPAQCSGDESASLEFNGRPRAAAEVTPGAAEVRGGDFACGLPAICGRCGDPAGGAPVFAGCVSLIAARHLRRARDFARPLLRHETAFPCCRLSP